MAILIRAIGVLKSTFCHHHLSLKLSLFLFKTAWVNTEVWHFSGPYCFSIHIFSWNQVLGQLFVLRRSHLCAKLISLELQILIHGSIDKVLDLLKIFCDELLKSRFFWCHLICYKLLASVSDERNTHNF